MRTALILLVALLVLPTAFAQGEAPQCGPISIPSPPAAPQPLSPGSSADVVVTVENAGARPVVVTVTASTTAPGWTLGPAPAPAQVTSGAPVGFAFRLTAGADATGPANIAFSANGRCDPPGGLAVCPGQVCASNSANTQVQAQLVVDDGFRFPVLENLNIPKELVVASVVLIGLASAVPFLLRRSKGGVTAACPEPLKLVKPGRGTSFPIELRNDAKISATAQFEVGPVPEGWSAFMPLPEVQLAAREARSLWLMVRSPGTAANGDVVDVELRLKDTHGKDNGVVKVRAEVQGAGEV